MEGKQVELPPSSSSSYHFRGKREMREKRLYEASLSGDVEFLNELMREDELTLDRVSLTCFDETPLHIAAMRGHVEFARSLLNHKKNLSTHLDSLGQSPLHMASANEHIEIVNMLLLVDSQACLVRNRDGKTPLHLAAMRGRVEIVTALALARPEAMEHMVDRGYTVLHLCVLHNRLEALKELVKLSNNEGFVNVQDGDGNTILHIATALKQVETIKYLFKETMVEVNAVNGKSMTALDIIMEHTMPIDLKAIEIRELLENSGGLRFMNLPPLALKNGNEIISPTITTTTTSPPSWWREHWQALIKLRDIFKSKKNKEDSEQLKNKRDALMIVATVIASMAYQAMLSPPGGFWQEDIPEDPNDPKRNILYYAGNSIMADQSPDDYNIFWKANTVSFITSLSIVLLLISGLPLENRIVMWILLVAMWATISCMAITYIYSVVATSLYQFDSVRPVMFKVICIWLGLIGIILLAHTCHFIIWIIKKVRKCCKKKREMNNNTEDRGQVQVQVQHN